MNAVPNPAPAQGDCLFLLQEEEISYQKHQVFKGLNLRIDRGEKLALIGPSGAGKSTLLKRLYELQPANSCLVHQHYALVPQLSVFHNVYMGRLDHFGLGRNLLNLIWPQKAIQEQILPWLEKLSMAHLMDKKTGELSGGEQQRTALARALYRPGQILLADEPISSIDPHLSDQVMRLVMASKETVVVSLHSVEQALRHATRVLGVRQGRILFDLEPRQVNQAWLDRLFQA